MTILNAHFDGKQIVLDDPVPDNLPLNAKVQVVVDSAGPSKALAEIAERAIDAGLPADYSTRFRDYMRGERAHVTA